MLKLAEQPLYWVVRGTVGGEDVSIVVEAETAAEAEYMGWKRNIPVVIVERASADDIADAKANKRFWAHTKAPRLRCFGRILDQREAACLILCGLWTALVHVRHAGLLPPFEVW